MSKDQKRLFLAGALAYLAICTPPIPLWFAIAWFGTGVLVGPFSLTYAPPDCKRVYPYLTWLMMLAGWPYAIWLKRQGRL